MSGEQSAEKANNKISFNYRADTVRIYKDTIKALGNPKYVRFMINPDYKRLYIQGSDTRDKNTLPVPEKGDRYCFVLHGRYFIRKISLLAGWSLDNSYVVNGTFLAEFNLVQYDLEDAMLINDFSY